MSKLDHAKARAEILQILKDLPGMIERGETKNAVLIFDRKGADHYEIGVMSNNPSSVVKAVLYTACRLDDICENESIDNKRTSKSLKEIMDKIQKH